MNITLYSRTVRLRFALLAACLVGFVAQVHAQLPLARPLMQSDFQENSPRGFGDRNNSWAQSMIWWNGALYVGTSRESLCTSYYALYQYVGLTVSPDFANTYFGYPPSDPDLSCAPDGADLSLQAEIWRWTPNGGWSRVFQSPLALDNPGPGAPYPPRTGKKLPYEIAIRDLEAYTEPDGTQALYALGVNSTIIWDRTKLPPPRILRSTDGTNWAPLPQDPGTFLGTLPFNPDHSSFRSAASYNGSLFALNGPAFGQGALIASANPKQGNNAWYLAEPASTLFYELAVFNGYLYLGGYDPVGGYAVYKTNAQGAPPYQLTTVVPPGAGLTVNPSSSVVSMHVFNNRLYVGTATFTEVVRINTDDTWDLVVGSPRTATTNGVTEIKYPISGVDAGWGLTLNDHAWRMDDRNGYLYIGTYNASTASRREPNGSLLLPTAGGQLYRTADGWYQFPITTNGFSNLGDARGGIFDFGIRTMANTPYGEFMGTANDYYGLEIFQAIAHGPTTPDPPAAMELEAAKTGTLVSWSASLGASLYHVWRAPVNLILIRDNTKIEGYNGTYGNKIPDTYVGTYVELGAVPGLNFLDTTAVAGQKYMYYVTAGSSAGVSYPSNLMAFPLLQPSITFAGLNAYNAKLTARGRFVDSVNGPGKVSSILASAQAQASGCQLDAAISTLNPKTASTYILSPDNTDAQVLFSKMVRRLQLYKQYPQQVVSLEFCTGVH